MHETLMAIAKIGEQKQKLMDMFREELCEDKEVIGCHIEKIGDIADMIKDLCEAEKECMEKKYYEMMICALMEEDQPLEEIGRMGYDKWHYASGKFAPKGRGHRVGYERMPMDWRNNPMNQNPHDAGPYWMDAKENMRMGYHPADDYMDGMHYPSKYGVGYDEYKERKKHYTETHSSPDHESMDAKIEEATHDAIDAMKEMWMDAKPETRRMLTTDVAMFLEEMKKTAK